MSLMAIILWALHPLSPWKRFYERTRHLLRVTAKYLQDDDFIARTPRNAGTREGVPLIEAALDKLNAGIDLLIYIRARELLGSPASRWHWPKRFPDMRRRTRSFTELYARFEACALRFDRIERLAKRRAQKLKRLLAESDTTLDPPAHAALIDDIRNSLDRAICLPLLRSDWWGRRIASTTGAQRQDGGGSRAGILSLRAGLRVRAPP